MNKQKMNKKGITLIALVITIIVLLILAGAAINMAINTDGLFGKAQSAAEKYNQGADHERIRLARLKYSAEKLENPDLSIEDSIKQEEWCSYASYNEVAKMLKLTTIEGKKYTLKEDGTIINGHFDYMVYSLAELKSTILSAIDGSVIGIIGDITVNTSLGDGTSKKITLAAGDANSSLNMDNGTSSGLSLTIEGFKINTSGNSYVGFKPDTKVKYLNCTIENTYFTMAPAVEFENCTFNQSKVEYNIWTYHADATFTNCTFNCNGKSVLIYGENTSGNNVVTLNGCVFKAAAPANDGKAAIEVDSRFVTYTVYINNCTSTGFDAGAVSGNDLWNNKKGTKATIIVDGVTVVTPE